MAKKKAKKELPLWERAKKCLEDYQEREADNIKRAEDAIRFRAGEQWPEPLKRSREDQYQDGGPRPCPVMDKTDQYVRQIVNEERQNRAAIRIRPVDDKADKEVAEILTGIVRHIEDASNALSAYTTAGEQAIDGGFGFFRLVTEYEDDDSFDQDIRIKRIANRFSVALGPHNEPDGSDTQEAVIWMDMPRDHFEEEYPDSKMVDFKADDGKDGWASEQTVRIAEYMYIERMPSKIFLMEDGSVLNEEEFKSLEEMAAQQGMPVPKPVKERDTITKQVKWCKVSGAEVLDEKDMVGRYIPVIKVIGSELCMPDGKIRLSGAVEPMMDPQRVHNYAIAGVIESVALAPRAPWVAAKEAIAGLEGDYKNANKQNIAVLTYNHLDDQGNQIAMPQRTPPAGMAPGWQALLQVTDQSIQGSVGMYGPSVGAKSQEKSGIALQEQKTQGMVGNFHFPDNLARSIKHCGRILVDWIPSIYDTARVARIIGEDDSEESAELNPDQEQPVMPKLNEYGEEIGLIYNIGIGKYDVAVSTGPSYTAKRQEAAQSLLDLTSQWPELKAIAGDKLLKSLDIPGADEMADRMQMMLPPQVQEMEANKDKKPLDPKTQAAMAQVQQMGQMLQQREQILQQAEQQLQQKAQEIGANESSVQSDAAKLEADRRVFEADMKRYQAEMALAELQKEHEEMQNNGEEGQTKQYEADMKYRGELAKAAAEVLKAQIAASPTEADDGMESELQPDHMAMMMQMLDRMVSAINAPRETQLIVDEMGTPVGSRSVVQGAEVMQ